MYKIILVAFYVTIYSLNIVAAEPSAFGAGNLDNPNPYGLTSGEKTILKNKNKINKVLVKSNNQANEVDSLRERIDGLQSIVESLSIKSYENKRSLVKLQEKNQADLKNSDEYGKRLDEIVEENSKLITNNILLLEKMRVLTDTINKEYVNKSEFNKLVESVNEFKSLVVKELKESTKPKESPLSTLSNGEIATKAKEFYNKQYYTKGIEYYTYLISKNYKPANSHFMIGQMKFKRKNYGEAISYYKKSASLYSKASYMPELMLNTAVSMDKTNDKKNAKIFYNGVIGKFPKSTQSKSAKKYLKSI